MNPRILTVALPLAALLVAGCGGETSSDSAPAAPAASVTLSASNVDLVARAAANAGVSSANVAEVNPAAGARTASPVQGRSVQELVLALTGHVVVGRTMAKGAPAASSGVRSLALITRMEDCAAGGSVAGALDDRDNSGAASPGDLLSVTLVQCRPRAGDLINGTVSATYSVVQTTPTVSVSATVTYAQLQASSTEGSFAIDGSFTYNLTQIGRITTAQLSIGASGLTAAVTGSNYNDTVTLHAGYTVTAARDPDAVLPGSAIPGLRTLSVNGAISAASIGGTIIVTTPVTIRQYDIDAFPREGQLQVRGVNNARLVLTVLSTTTVRVQLDEDGDSVFEVDKNVAWTELI